MPGKKGKIIFANIEIQEDGSKKYKVNGTLFFGSVFNFKELFDINNDPQNGFLDLRYAKVMDHSAIDAINSIAGRYEAAGKRFTLIRPSKNCRLLLENVKNITSIHIAEDKEDKERFTAFV